MHTFVPPQGACRQRTRLLKVTYEMRAPSVGHSPGGTEGTRMCGHPPRIKKEGAVEETSGNGKRPRWLSRALTVSPKSVRDTVAAAGLM